MDPTSVAPTPNENGWGYASNRHLYEWLVENETNNEQIQTFMSEVDKNYTSKQPNVNFRKIELAEIYDSVERIYEARQQRDGMSWFEDYISNETDPQIKLPQSNEIKTEQVQEMTPDIQPTE
jgi:hypothetical protein